MNIRITFEPLKLKNIKYPHNIPCIHRIRMIYNDNKNTIDKFCKDNDLNVEDTLYKFIRICNQKDKDKEELQKKKEKENQKKENQKKEKENEKHYLEIIKDLPTIIRASTWRRKNT
jgi:negative regulator of genetic competence, sporulation and motility